MNGPGGTSGGVAPPPHLLTVPEVARALRVSRMTVYRMIHNGDLPYVKVGTSYRVARATVDEMLIPRVAGQPRDGE